jgi:uncharacterized protein
MVAHGWAVRLASMTTEPNRDLIFGACSGNSRLVLAALRRGANPNARYRRRPVLIWAIQQRHLNVTKALVRAGASLERRDDLGFTPLGQAVGEGDLQIVNFLLMAGAKVDGRTAGGTPLHTACAYSRLAISKLLLARGADPLAVDDDGRKPVSYAKPKSNRTDRLLQKMLKGAEGH